ncbi:MAG: hypothetical protein IKE27_07340 [Oscillospiraceae bacterium]|nr:hypothetical protein [Oscillospiraceae bacterium]
MSSRKENSNRIADLFDKHPVIVKAVGIMPVVWSIIYAVFNLFMSITHKSYWFLSIGAWFLIIGILKIYVRKGRNDVPGRKLKTAGLGILFLAIILSGIVCIGIAEGHNPVRHMIIMIAIAAYAFTALTAAVIRSIKAHKRRDDILLIERNISLMSAVGGLLSLERGMLGTFGDPTDRFTLIMEITTGAGAFLFIALVGLSLLLKKPYDSQPDGHC